MGGDAGYLRESLQPVEFLDDRVRWFATHGRYVRYSYTKRKQKCTILLKAFRAHLCENQTMKDVTTQRFIEWIAANLDKKAGKTQTGLAERLGVAHPQITQLLKGKRDLKIREVPIIAEYLGTPPPPLIEAAPGKQIRAALLAYGVHESQLELAVDVLGNFKRPATGAPPEHSPSRGSQPHANPRHESEPSQ